MAWCMVLLIGPVAYECHCATVNVLPQCNPHTAFLCIVPQGKGQEHGTTECGGLQAKHVVLDDPTSKG